MMHDALVGIARVVAVIMPGVCDRPRRSDLPAAARCFGVRASKYALGAGPRQRGITPPAGENPPDARVLVRDRDAR